jgi:ATP-dependent RNA helicase RhlB
MTSQLLSDIPFNQFPLPERLQQAIEETGYDKCTLIQAQALPLALGGRDVAGQAQTGTGKTIAFLVALYAQIEKTPASAKRTPQQPRALIIAPTRELAMQIHKEAQQLGKYLPFKLVLVYGGLDYKKQAKQFESGADILIGTPGRIIDYYKQSLFDLKSIQVVVLDEADRMFDLGFIKDIRYLLKRLPKPENRLSMLFSATLSFRVMELAYEHMNNPQLVKIETDKITADKVRQLVYYPANMEKIPLLLGLLQQHNPQRTMIFVNTKHTGEKLLGDLMANDYKTALLSGDVPQRKRQRLLKGFQNGEYPILVATDVASRGLHIAEVSHVINFDLPQSVEDYVHRIGRTARVGLDGDAISFACEDYAIHLPEIEDYIGYKIPHEKVTADLLVTSKSLMNKRKGRKRSNPKPTRTQHQKSRPHDGSHPQTANQ